MVFCAFDVTKHILNAFGTVRLFKILTEIFRKMVIFSIFYFLFSYSVQRSKGGRIKLSKNLLSPIFVAKEVPGIYLCIIMYVLYTPSQNMTRVSIHAALLYTAYILVHVHTLYQINLTQSYSAQSCLYHRERILKTSTLSCNEEKEEITKPPPRWGRARVRGGPHTPPPLLTSNPPLRPRGLRTAFKQHHRRSPWILDHNGHYLSSGNDLTEEGSAFKSSAVAVERGAILY
jgi:hypothetical protein